MMGGGEGDWRDTMGVPGPDEQGVWVVEIHIAERWNEDIDGPLSELSGPSMGERARAANRLLGVRGVMGNTVVMVV